MQWVQTQPRKVVSRIRATCRYNFHSAKDKRAVTSRLDAVDSIGSEPEHDISRAGGEARASLGGTSTSFGHLRANSPGPSFMYYTSTACIFACARAYDILGLSAQICKRPAPNYTTRNLFADSFPVLACIIASSWK